MTPEQLDERQLDAVMAIVNNSISLRGCNNYRPDEIRPLDTAPDRDFACFLVKYNDYMPEIPIVNYGSHVNGIFVPVLVDGGRLVEGAPVDDEDAYYGYIRMRPNYSRELANL